MHFVFPDAKNNLRLSRLYILLKLTTECSWPLITTLLLLQLEKLNIFLCAAWIDHHNFFKDM